MDLAALGHRVAALRHGKGWSIDKLADASGVGRRTVITVEGAQKLSRIDTLYAIASGLGLSLSELFEGL